MGIEGLTSAVAKLRGSDFQWTRDARGPPVVVDGMGLIYKLLREQSDLILACHWPHFGAMLLERLLVLQQVSEHVLVVLDGLTTPLKQATIVERSERKIESIEKVLCGSLPLKDATTILPMATCEIVIEMLTQHGIETIVCAGDADCRVAHESLSRHAIVLAQDSDYFIFRTGGYAPLDSLHFDPAGPAVTGATIARAAVALTLSVPEPYLRGTGRSQGLMAG
eukprot:m.2310 g.2310  ORF g.2310 m.2310 type:complete len:223 (+) comp735_c0_seq1:23-691(+)